MKKKLTCATRTINPTQKGKGQSMTNEELEKLFQECGYSPEKIGVELLRRAGYYVFVPMYSNEQPTVKTQEFNGKVLY